MPLGAGGDIVFTPLSTVAAITIFAQGTTSYPLQGQVVAGQPCLMGQDPLPMRVLVTALPQKRLAYWSFDNDLASDTSSFQQ